MLSALAIIITVGLCFYQWKKLSLEDESRKLNREIQYKDSQILAKEKEIENLMVDKKNYIT